MLWRLKEKSLIKEQNLIDIHPTGHAFSLYIPENHRWTFSENDYYEQNVVYWFNKILSRLAEKKSNPIFYDVGANCGYYSLLAAEQTSKIIAFEPSKESFQLTKLNFLRNKKSRIRLNPMALTNKAAELTFYTYSSSGNDSLYRRDIPKGHELKYKRSYKVKACPLDEFVSQENINLPDFIKMDIEGAELYALEGSKKTLQKAQLPAIIVEYSEATSHDAGYAREKIRDTLMEMGYLIYGLSDDNKTTKLTKLDGSGKGESSISNLIAVPNTTLGKSLIKQ